jgi:hypothetical protein
MQEPEEEEPKPKSESSESFLRVRAPSVIMPEKMTIIPPPIEDLVDIEYDKIINFGV